MKEDISLKKQYANASEEYGIAIYFYEQYHSPRCWATVEEANDMFFKAKEQNSTARSSEGADPYTIFGFRLG